MQRAICVFRELSLREQKQGKLKTRTFIHNLIQICRPFVTCFVHISKIVR